MKQGLKHLNKYYIVLLLLVTSLLIRVHNLEHFAGFDYDQEVAARSAQKIISGDFTLIGQEVSVGGIFVGPFYNYLIAIALLISRGDPVSIYYFHVFLGLASTALAYFIGKSLTPKLGALSSILYLILFKFIYFDKTASPSNPLPFLTLLSLFVATRKLKLTHRSLLTFAIAGFATQLHPAGLALIAVPLALLFSPIKHFGTKTKLINLATGILLFLIWFSPLIIFDLRHNYLNLKGLVDLSNTPGGYPLIFRTIKMINTYTSSLITTILPRINIWSLALTLSLATLFFKEFKAALYNNLPITAMLLASPAIFIFYSNNVPDYYLLPSSTAFIFIISYIFNKGLASFNFVKKIATILLVILIFSANLHAYLNFYNPYSLHAKKQTVKTIKKRFGNQPTNIKLQTDYSQQFGFRYLFDWQNLNYQIVDQNPDVIISIPAEHAANNYLYGDIGLYFARMNVE